MMRATRLAGAVLAMGLLALPRAQARGPQSRPSPTPTPGAAPAPALVSREGQLAPALLACEPGSEPRPLGLARVHIEATVVGLLARTRTTLVFRNDTGRVLEGELVFPLPPGATVAGYALDVEGELVDAVPVGREQARIAFEQEVRRGVDPGLVEWVHGNAFRTRVYPVPARGTRTVRVDFVSELATPPGGPLYLLPLGLRDAVPDLSLRVEVVKCEAEPEARGEALGDLTFERWRDSYVAERSLKDATLSGDLVVALPPVAARAVAVEESEAGVHFLARDATALPSPPPLPPARKIALLWDASLSRSEADREPELRFVAAWLGRLGEVEVEVIAFRNAPEPARRFTVRAGDASAVVAHLRGLPLDGGTSFHDLVVGPPTARPIAGTARQGIDCALLVSDGIATLDEALPEGIRVPTWALPAGPRADRAFLRRLAESTGGALLDPARTGEEAALSSLGIPPMSLVAVDVEPAGAVQDLVPALPRVVASGAEIAGRLVAPEARLRLHYARPGVAGASIVSDVVVRRAEAASGDLVGLAWAQRRVEELAVFPERNREQLTRLGQRFGIVTPGTSFLVLETLEQHLAHGIEPPATRPALREAYRARRAAIASGQERAKLGKLQRAVVQWNERVAWWEREYAPARSKVAGHDDRARAERPDADSIDLGVEGGVAGGVEGGVPGGIVGGAVGGLPEATPARAAAFARPASVPMAAQRPANGAGHAAKDGKAAPPGTPSAAASIALQPWDPQTPYLLAMREAGQAMAYQVYLAERAKHGRSPAFFLDCADELARGGQRELALRVLTSVVELELDDPRLLRVAAHRLLQVGERDAALRLFEKVARLRPEEPQSPRDLALARIARADARRARPRFDRAAVAADYDQAVRQLHDVVLGAWDHRFPEIETIALEELNRVLAIAEREHLALPAREIVDPRLVKLLDVDLRVVMTWDTDETDMDLWVVEPSGERAYYGHNRTARGGLVSRDFTGGYGPEEYLLRRAPAGEYRVQTNYYGSRSQSLVGATTVQATVITNFGRPDEHRQALTLRLATPRDTVDVGRVTVGDGPR